MSPPGYLGIDLGTSAVKVLIQDEDGNPRARASRAYPTRTPRPGWAEQSPDDWWRAVVDAVGEAIADAPGLEIAAAGLSGQLNGFVLLDARMEPLADAVIWLDTRAEAEAKRLAEQADFPKRTGNALSAICVLPKLAWLQSHRPELMARTCRIALAKDYILLKLTGFLATDPSDAHSTAMTECGGMQWSPRLCALAQVDPAILPPIRPAGDIAGRVRARAADATGLSPGTAIATGAGDVAALAVGCGIVVPDRTAITLGTAGHVVSEASKRESASGTGLWRIPHGVFGRDLWLGLIMSGGLSLSWLRSVLGVDAPPEFETLDKLAAAAPVGPDCPIFLPFLEGVATPYNRPDVRGAFFGLSSSHGTSHLVRAVMEGVAFNARQCLEALNAAGASCQEVRLAEGGARSVTWCQIIADFLGSGIHLVSERDTSAAGAAIIGHAAQTGAAVEEIAQRSVRIDRVFEPEPDKREVLEASYQRYRAMCSLIVC